MKVKALITAAGMGTRFGALTARMNKALFKVGDETLIRHVVTRLKSGGVEDVTVVAGYQKERLKKELAGSGVRVLDNPIYRSSGILGSFRAARRVLAGKAFLFTTSDHFFSKNVLKGCLGGASDIRIVVQKKKRYTAEDAKVIITGTRVVEMGKNIDLAKASGEFGGMAYLSSKASRFFFLELERVFKKNRYAYMMGILKAISDKHGMPIHFSVCGENSRIEVDSVHDLIAARRMARKKTFKPQR